MFVWFNFLFYFCKPNRKSSLLPKFDLTRKIDVQHSSIMKDRIKKIMESQHMSQQVFADFIGIAPATLSGIFTERTKPTLNTVEAIKKRLPSLSTDWLLFGREPMYINQNVPSDEAQNNKGTIDTISGMETFLEFDSTKSTPTPSPLANTRINPVQQKIVNSRTESEFVNMKNIDKYVRKVVEIRVFYDDQTWESFVPAKK